MVGLKEKDELPTGWKENETMETTKNRQRLTRDLMKGNLPLRKRRQTMIDLEGLVVCTAHAQPALVFIALVLVHFLHLKNKMF